MDFIATVQEDQKKRIGEIAENLRQMGNTVSGVLHLTGIITGSTADTTLDKIKIEGVKSVEPARKVFSSSK